MSIKHEIRKIKYNSPEYRQVLKLRNNILRKPLGLNLFDEDLSLDKNQLIYGIFIENKIIACLQAVPLKDNTYKFRQMAVETKYQKMGFGRQLMEFVENELKKIDTEQIVLHARKTAVLFYQKLGYEIVSNEFIEVGILHNKMRKNILF